MLYRRLAVPLVAASVLAVVAAGCADQSAALRVGDWTYSDDDLRDELDAWAENEAYWETTGQPVDAIRGELAGSYDQQFVSQVLQQRVRSVLVERVFEDEGLELTGARRQDVRAELGAVLDGFPDSYGNTLVDDAARQVALEEELGPEGLNVALTTAAGAADIHVSSHYGRWDGDRYTVVPPDGPAPPPIDATDATGPVGG